MLLYQLAKDLDCMGRIEAAQELVKVADAEVIEALGKSAASDLFWGVQAESAKALAESRMGGGRDQLILALQTPHPKARRAIASALGTFHDSDAAAALRKLAEKDESYFVQADATYAWTVSSLKPAQPSHTPDIDQIEKFLFHQLNRSSYREVIRGAALNALAELPGVGRGDRPKALQAILDWTRRGHPQDVRGAAVKALGKILMHASSPEKARILDVLSELADEDNFRLRSHLVVSLEDSGCSEVISILGKIRQMEIDGRVRRAAQSAVDTLRTAGALPESLLVLKATLEKLEEDHKKLRSIVEDRTYLNHPEKGEGVLSGRS
jgi:aminopeptidase N